MAHSVRPVPVERPLSGQTLMACFFMIRIPAPREKRHMEAERGLSECGLAENVRTFS